MSSTPPSPSASHQDKGKSSWMPSFILALVAVLNVPPAIIVITSHFVNQHPWWSLLLLVVFAIFDFAVYILIKLLAKIRGSLARSRSFKDRS